MQALNVVERASIANQVINACDLDVGREDGENMLNWNFSHGSDMLIQESNTMKVHNIFAGLAAVWAFGHASISRYQRIRSEEQCYFEAVWHNGVVYVVSKLPFSRF